MSPWLKRKTKANVEAFHAATKALNDYTGPWPYTDYLARQKACTARQTREKATKAIDLEALPLTLE
jgi:hypothetical protein